MALHTSIDINRYDSTLNFCSSLNYLYRIVVLVFILPVLL